MLAGKASKHTKNILFLITDNITQDKLTVHHRGTKLMLADEKHYKATGFGYSDLY